MLLSDFIHKPQQHESDCLVACIEMILNYLHVPVSYNQLTKLLQTRWFGTTFGNVRYLASLGLSVTLGVNGDLDIFERHIELGLPILVNVRTLQMNLTNFLVGWEEQERQYAIIALTEPL